MTGINWAFWTLSSKFFFLRFSFVSQPSWSRGEWDWTTSFRGLPRTPTPASSEYHLTHVIVLYSLEHKALQSQPKMPVICPLEEHDSLFGCFYCKLFFFCFFFTVLKYSQFWIWVHLKRQSSWMQTPLLLWVHACNRASFVHRQSLCFQINEWILIYIVFVVQPSPSQQIDQPRSILQPFS